VAGRGGIMNTGAIFRFSLPTEVVYGVNTVSLLGSEVKRLGGKKAFIATDTGVRASGILEKAFQALNDVGVPFTLFDKVPVDPTDRDIDGMAEIVKKEGCNCVIGAGGGSVICACKGTALVANNTGKTKSLTPLHNNAN
jgi:alcohol dehydrogenase class IV